MAWQKVIWSPVEVDYLKQHKDYPVNQLTIALAKSKTAVKNKLAEISGSPVKTPGLATKKRSKIGKRKDCNNLFFRSGWEANTYRWLRSLKEVTRIEYEPTTFSFCEFGFMNGTVSYTPDFRITYADGSYEWLEVKGGNMKVQDKTKLRRFKKYYPDEFKHLVAITPGPKNKVTAFFKDQGIQIKWHYPDLHKQFRNTLPNWE